jgi:hypothetical protein
MSHRLMAWTVFRDFDRSILKILPGFTCSAIILRPVLVSDFVQAIAVIVLFFTP